MKLSTLAVAVLASTALFSVTSAAGSGGVRGGSMNHEDGSDINHRALECFEGDQVGHVYWGKTCDWITKSEKNMVKRCNKSSALGNVFDLCASTCAQVGLGPCAPNDIAAEEEPSLSEDSLQSGDEDIDYGDSEAQSLINTNGAAPNGGQDVVCPGPNCPRT